MFVTSVIGELSVSTRGGAESLVLPLVARLHARGQVDAARAWVKWAAEGAPSASYRCVAVTLAFRANDDREVLSLTDGLSGRDEAAVAMLTYRARSLQRLGRHEAALAVLNDAVSRAGRLDDDEELLLSARYLRARCLIVAGRPLQARDDLHAIEARDSQYEDVAALLETLASATRSIRTPIPLDVKRAVFARDGGACQQCGESFDIQYDHVIPLAMGGSSTIENLQLLCGSCNRRKGATLG
jgi:hypothetical protein